MRLAESEPEHALRVVPLRRAIRADDERAGDPRTLFIDGDRCRCFRRNMRPAKHRAERVPYDGVGDGTDDGQRVAAVGPGQAAIQRLLTVERAHHSRTQLAHLHAVAQLVALIDRVREVAACVVEDKLTDACHRHRCAASQIDQHHHRATARGFRCRRDWRTACARGTGRRVGWHQLDRDQIRMIAREPKAARPFELARLACRQLNDANLHRWRTTIPSGFLRVIGLGIDRVRRPLVVAGDCDACHRAESGRWLTDRDARLVCAGGRTPHHELRIALVRRKHIRHPAAVV